MAWLDHMPIPKPIITGRMMQLSTGNARVLLDAAIGQFHTDHLSNSTLFFQGKEECYLRNKKQ